MTDKDTITAHHEAAHAVVKYRAAGHVEGTASIAFRADRGSLGHAADDISDRFNADHMTARVVSCRRQR
jgi:hypothetical protein